MKPADKLLHFGPKLDVPIDFATARCAVIGISGAGKSSAFAVMAEECWAQSIPYTWIDPLGASWGMRSSADGLGVGIPIPIFGGYHGDLPLRPDAGAWLAREIYGLGISAILDLSAFDPREQCRFVTEHFSAMMQLHLKEKKVRSIFLDEAATIAPQRASNEDDNASAVAVWRMHTGGRAVGLGLKTATQSAAEQDKRSMKQSELFVALRTFSPHDQKPVLDYLRTSVDATRAKEIAGTLAHLENGEAWFIAPRWLGEVRRARFRMRRTFDSSRTPALGENFTAPKTLAQVDVDRIRKALERDLEVTEPTSKDKTHKSVASRSVEIDGLRAEIAELKGLLEGDDVLIESLKKENNTLRERLFRVAKIAAFIDDGSEATRAAEHQRGELSPISVSQAVANAKDARKPRSGGISVPSTASPKRKRTVDDGMPPAAHKLLVALAQHHPAKFTWGQVATLAGLKPSGGYYNTGKSYLREVGYVLEEGNLVFATPAGLTNAGEVPKNPSTPDERLKIWCERLPGVAPDMLRQLAINGKNFMETTALAEAIGRKPTGGYWNSGLALLRNNGLVEMNGKALRIAELLRP